MHDPTFENFQVLSSSTDQSTLAGMPANTFEASYRDPEFGPQHMLEVGTIIYNRVYYVQYIADTPIYQTHFSLAERMIESLNNAVRLYTTFTGGAFPSPKFTAFHLNRLGRHCASPTSQLVSWKVRLLIRLG